VRSKFGDRGKEEKILHKRRLDHVNILPRDINSSTDATTTCNSRYGISTGMIDVSTPRTKRD